MSVRDVSVVENIYLLLLFGYRGTMEKQEARRKRPDQKEELLNNIKTFHKSSHTSFLVQYRGIFLLTIF